MPGIGGGYPPPGYPPGGPAPCGGKTAAASRGSCRTAGPGSPAPGRGGGARPREPAGWRSSSPRTRRRRRRRRRPRRPRRVSPCRQSRPRAPPRRHRRDRHRRDRRIPHPPPRTAATASRSPASRSPASFPASSRPRRRRRRPRAWATRPATPRRRRRARTRPRGTCRPRGPGTRTCRGRGRKIPAPETQRAIGRSRRLLRWLLRLLLRHRLLLLRPSPSPASRSTRRSSFWAGPWWTDPRGVCPRRWAMPWQPPRCEEGSG